MTEPHEKRKDCDKDMNEAFNRIRVLENNTTEIHASVKASLSTSKYFISFFGVIFISLVAYYASDLKNSIAKVAEASIKNSEAVIRVAESLKGLEREVYRNKNEH